MPDDTLHVDRFILTQPRERPGKGWVYTATSPEDPAEYLGWLYPNPCDGDRLQQVLAAVAAARALDAPTLLRLHAAGHKRAAIGPPGGYLFAITDPVPIERDVERGVLPHAPIPIRDLVIGLFELVGAIRAMARFPYSHGWLGPEHCFVKDDGHLVVVNPWQGWVEDHLRQGLTTGTSDWQYTWVAPETVFDPARIGVGSDLFTACAIGYTLATGQPPFDSASALALDPALFTLRVPDPRVLRTDLPEGLARIFERGLAADWDRRYHRPEDLLQDLRAVSQGGMPSAAPAAAAIAGATTTETAVPARSPASSGLNAVSAERSSARLRVPSSARRREGSDRAARSSTERGVRAGSDPLPSSRARRASTDSGISRGERERRPGRSAVPLIVLGVAGLALVVSAILLLTRDGPTIPPTADPLPTADAPVVERPEAIPERDGMTPFGPARGPRPAPVADPVEPRRMESTASDPTGTPRRGMFAALEQDVEIGELPPVAMPEAPEPSATPPVDPVPGLRLAVHVGHWGGEIDRIPWSRQPEQVHVVDRVDRDRRPRAENYALRFEGWLQIEQPGYHIFHLRSDDGSKLWLSDQSVIDNDGYHSPETRSRGLQLQAGWYRLRVDYFQGTSDSALSLEWTPPGGDQRVLAGPLYHERAAGTIPATAVGEDLVAITEVAGGGRYELATARTGVEIYTDRDYRIDSLPQRLDDAILVRTANNDKHAGGDRHLVLELARRAVVFVALREEMDPPPTWAARWTPTDVRITAGDAGRFRLFRLRSGPGPVVLGGNTDRMGTSASNYFVLVRAVDPDDPEQDDHGIVTEAPPLAGALPTTPGGTPKGVARPIPEPDADTRRALQRAVDAVMAGGQAARGFDQPWSDLLRSLVEARDRLASIAIAHRDDLIRRHAPIVLNRTRLEVAGVDQQGMELLTNGGRSAVRMGWERIPAAAVAEMLAGVRTGLTADELQAIRLVRSAGGPVDPRLTAHRAALEALHGTGATGAVVAPSAANPGGVVRPAHPGEIVLRPSDAEADRAGDRYRLVDDPSAAFGRAWLSIALPGEAAQDRPEVGPDTPHLSYRFEAEADRTYECWIRARADGPGKADDALVVAFATPVVFEGQPFQRWVPPERHHDSAEINGFGKADGWFWTSGLSAARLDQASDEGPLRVRFRRSGTQEIRIYLIEGPHRIDLVWLSATQRERYAPHRVPAWLQLP